MKIILFDNNKINNLYPITLARPSWDILCAGTNLYELAQKYFKKSKIDLITRDYLTRTAKLKKTQQNKILLLDGSLAPSFKTFKALANAIAKRHNIIFKNKQKILAAYLDLASLKIKYDLVKKLKHTQVNNFLNKLKLPSLKVNWPSFNYIWEVITLNQQLLNNNLKHLQNDFSPYQPGVFIGHKVRLAKNVSLDTSHGPIIINSYTQIKPFVHLKGPLYIGKKCVINEFASIHASSIGQVSKLGGHIKTTLIQGYSNKQHDGFLGHSYVGGWVNIGAGTTNSNLKNSYGNVKMRGVKTNNQFMGCILGDYTKTAINTSILTGKIIGVNSLLYGLITNDVPSFTNAGSWLKNPVACPLPLAIKTQQAMAKRRGIKHTNIHSRILTAIYKITQAERHKGQIKNGQLELIPHYSWNKKIPLE